MKDAITYIVETVVCSGVFLLLYRLLLASRVSYLFARLYLMLSVALSAVIPLLSIPIASARVIEITVPMNPLFVPSEAAQVAAQTMRFDWGDAALVLYIVVVVGALALPAVELWRIRSFRRGADHTFEQGFNIYSSPRITASFLFGRSVFLADGLTGENRVEILAHEGSHIRHHHSVDMVLMSLMRAFLWFNPFVWIACRYLVEVHEYEADHDAIEAGCELKRYRQLILNQTIGYNPEITSGFADSLIKKRFIMMTKRKQRSRYAVLGYASIVPAVAVMVLLFGCVQSDKSTKEVKEAGEVKTATEQYDPNEAIDEQEPVFLKVEQMPKFNEGDLRNFQTWVAQRLKYPTPKDGGELVGGKVIVQFVIEKDGSLSSIEFLDQRDHSLHNAVSDVLKVSPRWTPGRQRDENVRVKFILPIDFKVK
ncbi:MAG: M56 family metallopeptidase [Tidjanibacter sp.]|nr:M56 family metallopeptidase [Tidjanibacter sp.]